GSGVLNTRQLVVGEAGIGNFEQTGGTNTVTDFVFNIGSGTGSFGNYRLSGGSLTATAPGVSTTIGVDGTGTFEHTGGTFDAGFMSLGRNSNGRGMYILNSNDAVLNSRSVG